MYKGINEFKDYKPRAYVVRKDNGIIVADTTSRLNGREQFYSNLLNVNQSTGLEVKYTLQSQTFQNIIF